jgi:hypothetical protein
MNSEEKGYEIMDWIHLAQDRDQWQALINMVIKHIVVWEFIISNIKEELPTCWSLSQ